MAKPRPVNGKGIMPDPTKAPGYSGSGTSEHSRHAAHSQNIRLGEGKRTDGRLLRDMGRALRKLEYQAREERDPTRRMKIEKNIGIKSAFISKLKKQYDDEHAPKTWDWETVETFPGEFEV